MKYSGEHFIIQSRLVTVEYLVSGVTIRQLGKILHEFVSGNQVSREFFPTIDRLFIPNLLQNRH